MTEETPRRKVISRWAALGWGLASDVMLIIYMPPSPRMFDFFLFELAVIPLLFLGLVSLCNSANRRLEQRDQEAPPV